MNDDAVYGLEEIDGLQWLWIEEEQLESAYALNVRYSAILVQLVGGDIGDNRRLG